LEFRRMILGLTAAVLVGLAAVIAGARAEQAKPVRVRARKDR
jgi:hypothetical protein